MLLLETGRIEAIGMLAGACLGGAGGEEEREREKRDGARLAEDDQRGST